MRQQQQQHTNNVRTTLIPASAASLLSLERISAGAVLLSGSLTISAVGTESRRILYVIVSSVVLYRFAVTVRAVFKVCVKSV